MRARMFLVLLVVFFWILVGCDGNGPTGLPVEEPAVSGDFAVVVADGRVGVSFPVLEENQSSAGSWTLEVQIQQPKSITYRSFFFPVSPSADWMLVASFQFPEEESFVRVFARRNEELLPVAGLHARTRYYAFWCLPPDRIIFRDFPDTVF